MLLFGLRLRTLQYIYTLYTIVLSVWTVYTYYTFEYHVQAHLNLEVFLVGGDVPQMQPQHSESQQITPISIEHEFYLGEVQYIF